MEQKKQDLWMLPPVLIVHLKRFKYNDYGKIGTKNEAAIEYPVTGWDLKSRVKSKRGVYPRYDLYAVSNHMGGLGSGHYTAHALNRFDDVWYEFNDSSYRAVQESIHRRLSKSAYVLFYNRSEGDASMPLNERSPLIRRQSVSRPDLWPHSQVDDPRQIKNFARASRRNLEPLQAPDLSSRRNETSTSSGMEILASIKEGQAKNQSTGPMKQSLPDPPSFSDPPSTTQTNGKKGPGHSLERDEEFEKPKPRRKTRSTKPTQV